MEALQIISQPLSITRLCYLWRTGSYLNLWKTLWLGAKPAVAAVGDSLCGAWWYKDYEPAGLHLHSISDWKEWRGGEEEGERRWEKALPNAQLLSSAFFMAFEKGTNRKQKTHFLHASLKSPFSLPTYPDCGIFFMLGGKKQTNVMSVRQTLIGKIKSVDE